MNWKFWEKTSLPVAPSKSEPTKEEKKCAWCHEVITTTARCRESSLLIDHIDDLTIWAKRDCNAECCSQDCLDAHIFTLHEVGKTSWKFNIKKK